MSDENQLLLVDEIAQALDALLASDQLDDDDKTSVLRRLLAITLNQSELDLV